MLAAAGSAPGQQRRDFGGARPQPRAASPAGSRSLPPPPPWPPARAARRRRSRTSSIRPSWPSCCARRTTSTAPTARPRGHDGLLGTLVFLFASDVLEYIEILGSIYQGSNLSTWTSGHQSKYSACKKWEILKQDYSMKQIYQRTFEDLKQIKLWNFSSGISMKRRSIMIKMQLMPSIRKKKKRKKRKREREKQKNHQNK